MTVHFVTLDAEPYVIVHTPDILEAWVCRDGEWKHTHPAEPMHEGRSVSKERFERMYPHLPAFPKTVRQEEGKRDKASE